MADRPIIFSAPMVRALLAGRKTQTRRILKPRGYRFFEHPVSGWRWEHVKPSRGLVAGGPLRFENLTDVLPCAVGDRLWLKEAWRIDGAGSRVPAEACLRHGRQVEYRADGYEPTAWMERSPIFMPRRASRLTLLVTDVRVERLQDISEGDAAAEGVELESADPPFHYVPGIWPHSITAVGVEEPGGRHAARSFAKLWGHINGSESWQANPWVVAVTFTVRARNIDQLAPIAEAAE